LLYSFNNSRPLWWLGLYLFDPPARVDAEYCWGSAIYHCSPSGENVVLNVINARQIDDIVAIENHFARQLIHVFLDLVVFDHDDYEINGCKEFV
jgi:hypothetical protein